MGYTSNETHNVGNQVRVQANDKGTGKVGVPTAVALASKDSLSPATVNPSGAGSIPGARGTQG